MAICAGESGGNTTAVGDSNTAHVSCGLFQIRTLPGRPSCTKLKDYVFNIDYAYNLWRSEGFNPWTVYHLLAKK